MSLLQHLSRSPARLLPCPASSLTSCQQLRFKKFGKWIVPHRKPRWVPMARSKMFKNPPESTVPIKEQEHIMELNSEYLMRMRALQWYLYEDDLKAGDTGEAAIIAAKNEELVHQQNISDNEEINKRIAAARVERLKKESEERRIMIEQELRDYEEQEAVRLDNVEKYVDQEIVEMDSRIKQDDLVKAIETAIANPVDYEYAIDLQGNIFRGRSTKSKRVDPSNYEKIPVSNQN